MLAPLAILWLGLLLWWPARPDTWLVVASGLPVVSLAAWRTARRRHVPLRAWIRANGDIVVVALALLHGVGVLMADTHGVTTDGVIYFTQLRSLVFDRDLDIAREFEFLNQPPRPTHIVPIGPLLLWTPLYLAVAAVEGIGRGLGMVAPPADPVAVGLGLPYIRAALLSSYAIGAAGLLALLWHLRARFPRTVAGLTVLLLFGATPLYWYMVYEPSMSHAASFGFVALFVVACARWLGPEVPAGAEARRHMLLGTLIGLAFLARSQEALFVVYPAVLVGSAPAPPGDRVRRALRLASRGFLGALPWLLIQLVVGLALFARDDYQLFGQGGYLNPLRSRWLDTLFSSWHGFLSWTPAAYVAVIGTVAYLRREWRWAASALLVLFLTAWVNGATVDWAGGWSFGGRRFSSALAMLAPGLAVVIAWLVRRPLLAVAPIVAGALYWNYLLMVQYTAGMLPKDEPVSFGRIVRQQAELHTRAPYWYPFAFPANVWFAWREGLPVDKYDVLSPEAPRPAFSLAFDRVAERFLLSGWDVPGGDDWGPCWWIGGTPATMAVPFEPTGRAVRIRVRTRTRFDEPPVRAMLALEVNGHTVGRFTAGLPDAATQDLVLPATQARAWLRRGFNVVAFRSLGVERVDPTDARPPGPLASRPGRHVWPVAVYSVEMEEVN